MKPASSDSSRFDTSQFYGATETCNAGAQSCTSAASTGHTPSPPEAARRVIDLEPVYVAADAGARKLVDEYCASEVIVAAEACGKALATGVATGYSAPVLPVFVAGLYSTFVDSKTCGKELASLYDCETEPR